MGNSDSLAWTSLLLAIAVAVVALLLALRLWWERQSRDAYLTAADRRHFFFQDLRRGFGLILMAYLAFGVYVGSRLPTFVMEPAVSRPAAQGNDAAGLMGRTPLERHPNRQFLAVWIGVFASTLLLLGLAVVDWIATRRYARRHRDEMDRQRLALFRDTIRHAHAAENDRVDGDVTE